MPSANVHPVRVAIASARIAWTHTCAPVARSSTSGPTCSTVRTTSSRRAALPERRDVPRSDVLHAPGAARAREGRVLHARGAHGHPAARRASSRVSEYAKRGAVEHAGADPSTRGRRPRRCRSRRVHAGRIHVASGSPFVLFVGALEPHKNVPSLIRRSTQLDTPTTSSCSCGLPAWGPRAVERGDRARSSARPHPYARLRRPTRRRSTLYRSARRRSCTRRSPKVSACRCSRRWRAAHRSSRRRARPPRSSLPVRRCSSRRATTMRSAMRCEAC